MRKIVLIIATVTSLAAIAISAPNTAQARFGAGAIADAVNGVSPAQPAQYYRSYRRYPNYYGAYAYSPNYNYYYTPGYQYPGSREALDTCSFC